MIDSRQSRSLLVVILWVTACIGASRLFHWRPIPTTGVVVLVSAIALALLYRLEGRRVFWSNTVGWEDVPEVERESAVCWDTPAASRVTPQGGDRKPVYLAARWP